MTIEYISGFTNHFHFRCKTMLKERNTYNVAVLEILLLNFKWLACKIYLIIQSLSVKYLNVLYIDTTFSSIEHIHISNGWIYPTLITLVTVSDLASSFSALAHQFCTHLFAYFLPFILPVIRFRAASNSSSVGSATCFFPFLCFSLPEYFASNAAASESMEFRWFWRLDIKATKLLPSGSSVFLFLLLQHWNHCILQCRIYDYYMEKWYMQTMINAIKWQITSLVFEILMV